MRDVGDEAEAGHAMARVEAADAAPRLHASGLAIGGERPGSRVAIGARVSASPGRRGSGQAQSSGPTRSGVAAGRPLAPDTGLSRRGRKRIATASQPCLATVAALG